MKNLMRKFAVLALGLAVVMASCSKDDNNNNSSITGTYTGVVDAVITGLVDDSYPLTFTISGNNNAYTLSTNINIPVSGSTMTIPVNVELTDIVAYKNVTVTMEGLTATLKEGYGFNVKPAVITIAALGATVNIASQKVILVGSVNYAGLQGIAEVEGQDSKGASLYLTGSLNMTMPSPVTLPLSLALSGSIVK